MSHSIVEALSQIAREKGVELRVLVNRLEDSLLSAAKRKHGANAQVSFIFDEAAGVIEMSLTKIVVGHVSDTGLEMTSAQAKAYKENAAVGDEIVIPLDIAEFGRNAIQAAKQVLIQGVREAERERVYTDFADKVGALVRGVVQQVDRGTIVLKLDTAEAVIPAREVLHRDRFRQRELVRALVIDVDKNAKGPQIILSRAHPDFLQKLFEAEVPEITDKIVDIKAVSREPGHRSKIAVTSNDERVDAVGACVGIKGTRVQSVVKELGGERIDIVPWSADPVVFVSRSLAPAKVVEAKADPETRKVTVIVPDDQLSLAIGKQGQNARLAAKLTGWKIELHSESEFATQSAVAQADVAIADLEGVTEATAAALLAAGIETAVDVERTGLDGLSALEDLGTAEAELLFGVAIESLAQAREQAAKEAQENMAEPDFEKDARAEALTEETDEVELQGEIDHDEGQTETGEAEAGEPEAGEPEAGEPEAGEEVEDVEETSGVEEAEQAPAEDNAEVASPQDGQPGEVESEPALNTDEELNADSVISAEEDAESEVSDAKN